MSRFTDKIVFITGAASGIGFGIGLQLSTEGAKVIVADINWELAQKSAAVLGKSAIAVKLDQSDPQSVRDAIAFAEETFGGVDCAVNAAAVPGPLGALEDLEPEDIQRVYGVNLIGVSYLLKYEVAAIKKRGGGAIVNIASTTGHRPVPYLGVYSASKSGVLALSAIVAAEAGPHHIRVNSVSPGYVDTPSLDDRIDRAWAGSVVPTGKCGSPQNIADAVSFLLSEQVCQITGTNLTVDGGLIACHTIKPPGF